MNLPRMKPFVAGLLLFVLAGCDSNGLPHVFGGNEVPRDVKAEPRAVTTPPPQAVRNQTWMRLGDVPSMPRDFTPENLIEQSKQQMVNDRVAAAELRQKSGIAPAAEAPKSARPSASSPSVASPPRAASPQTPVARNNKPASDALVPPQFGHPNVPPPPPGLGLTSTGLINPYPISPW